MLEEAEEINGTIEVANMNGDVHQMSSGQRLDRWRDQSTPAMSAEMPTRSRKTTVKRPTRGDGATILTQNDRYSVKLLPSTPKELRRNGMAYRGGTGAGHLALAVTRDKAYVWDYTLHAPASNPRIFELPFATKSSEPLPHCAFVTSGTTSDVGLILLAANTGKIVFYESIERAASLGLFHERDAGVEGALPSLYSGETVTTLVSASHAGFVVILSSGRIAQITTRDAQGKARVFAQFLHASESSSGGLLGSIKGFLGAGSWRTEVAAVRIRALGTRGRIQVISLTERAVLQIWDLEWNGQYTFKSTIDFKEVITRELRRRGLPESQGQAESVKALDFRIQGRASSGGELVAAGVDLPIDFVVMLEVGTPDNRTYVLANIGLEGQRVQVTNLVYLDKYSNRASRKHRVKPRLHLTRADKIAVVAFEDAIAFAAIDEPVFDGPEAQLHASYIQPPAFEDIVYLRKDKETSIVDSYNNDDATGSESILAFIAGAGLLRIAVAEPATQSENTPISIKTRIEQAVFHGALQDANVIDFSRIDQSQYSLEEVEEASLAISSEILDSSSTFVSTSSTSMETHLTYKAQALRALITHIRENFPAFSKSSTWRLMWDAEKVAASQQMWQAFEEHVAACSQTKRKATVMDEVCALVVQELQVSQDLAQEDDAVRCFFIHYLNRLDKLLVMIYNFLKYLKTQNDKDSQTVVRLVTEADDLWNRGLETVFSFRTEHATTYGIAPSSIQDGVLTDEIEQAELPEAWTSTDAMLKAAVRMVEISRGFANDEWDKTAPIADMAAILKPLIFQLNEQNPRLVELSCAVYQERIHWLASRPTEKDRDVAERLRINYESTRYDQFRSLAVLGQVEAGMQLAEKYRDMHTLTEIVIGEMQYLVGEIATTEQQEQQQMLAAARQLKSRVASYFERFGDDWANAYFDEGFSGSGGHMLRDGQQNCQAALTKYLRAEPSRAKVCWINDVTADTDFEHAGKCLLSAAQEQETNLWNKNVGLSMAKLTLLAAQEDSKEASSVLSQDQLYNALPENELELVDIQSRLYRHFVPEIQHCIDRQAELEIAMQRFGFKNQDLHALKQLLEQNVNSILDHTVLSAPELIDVLTLMDSIINTDVDDRNLGGTEFFLALKALNAIATTIPQHRFETLLQLIWKRCYLHDDWIELNTAAQQETKSSSDRTAFRLRQTAPWRTLYHALDENLFDDENSRVRYLSPSECLGAGCRTEDLEYRWQSMDILAPIMQDNKVHDEQLQAFIEDRRLEMWVEGCFDAVRKEIKEEAEEEAAVLLREREVEGVLEGDTGAGAGAVNGGLVNGRGVHGAGANGYVDGGKDEHVGEGESDDDVEMG